jgi:hypothetical protein
MLNILTYYDLRYDGLDIPNESFSQICSILFQHVAAGISDKLKTATLFALPMLFSTVSFIEIPVLFLYINVFAETILIALASGSSQSWFRPMYEVCARGRSHIFYRG